MKPVHTPQTFSSPSSWDEIPWGTQYQHAIGLALLPWWSRVFGFHLLKIGALSTQIATDACAVSHQVNVTLNEGEGGQVIADPYQLPFSEKSVDACLLAHTLSYSSDPHRILREVDRVLIDDGWLLLSGFNPVSMLGLGKVTLGICRRQPYCARMFTQMRMMDWFSLLNYEVMYQGAFHVMPWREPMASVEAHRHPFGCLTLMVARKRTIPLTMNPLRQKFGRVHVRNRTVGVTKSYRKSSTSR